MDEKKRKIEPGELIEKVLAFCQEEGYTLDEVLSVGNGIGNSVRHIFWDNFARKISYKREDEKEAHPQKI